MVFSEVGVVLSRQPPTVRGPDVVFYSGDRVPQPLPVKGFLIPPDLAVEVVSPSNRFADVIAKVAEYVLAGTELVWVIDPIKRTAAVYRAPDGIQLLTEDDSLEGRAMHPSVWSPG